ncbi:50S ribosomal protein L17 [bacterium]|nr:50S ribosomal protein L17 [bacterium]
MRHRKKKKILDRKVGPRKALLKSLAINLILNGRIETTEAKAKALKPFIERLVSYSRKGDLSARRRVNMFLNNRQATKKLIEEIGVRYAQRPGGYTRIIKGKIRKGDGAKTAFIEFV